MSRGPYTENRAGDVVHNDLGNRSQDHLLPAISSVCTNNDQTWVEILHGLRKKRGDISDFGDNLDLDISCSALTMEVQHHVFKLTLDIVSGLPNHIRLSQAVGCWIDTVIEIQLRLVAARDSDSIVQGTCRKFREICCQQDTA